MSSQNSFEGLSFRIMEVLEKSGTVPLTALEVAYRLHEGEYRNQLLDTVIHRVTASCHAMKYKGKILLADARDKDGRLTYTLPKRMVFPPKPGVAPANPVLRADIAAKIVPVEPKPPAKRKRPNYAEGVGAGIVAILDKAPHPLSSTEVIELAEKAGVWPAGTNVKPKVEQTLYYLAKTRKIRTMPSTGRTRMAKCEYLTRRTGKYPVMEPQLPLAAPKPVPAPKPAPAPGLFRPVAPVEQELLLIKLAYTQQELDRVEAAAKAFGVPVDAFCKQAIEFAMGHTS